MLLTKKIIEFILTKSAKEFDSFYLYDIQIIRDNCRIFQNISYPQKSIHFATMANANPQFLKIVREEGLKVFVNSMIHLNRVIEAGFSQQEIIFTASALSEKMMLVAYESGVQVYLDSPNQLAKWIALFSGKLVGIRCNIGDRVVPYTSHAGYFIGSKSRLGFTEAELEAIEDKSVIKSLHLYSGTDIFDVGYLIKCYKELIAFSERFPNLETLNFGGGFGISENGKDMIDMHNFNQKVTRLMEEVSCQRGKPIGMILEPGRMVGGRSGYFVCNVTDIKKRGAERLVGLNASTTQFPRPLMYPDIAAHPMGFIRNNEIYYSDIQFITTVYGCSTYSRDIFAKNVLLPELQVGDIVVFGNAGSYSASARSLFLGFPSPEEYFI